MWKYPCFDGPCICLLCAGVPANEDGRDINVCLCMYVCVVVPCSLGWACRKKYYLFADRRHSSFHFSTSIFDTPAWSHNYAFPWTFSAREKFHISYFATFIHTRRSQSTVAQWKIPFACNNHSTIAFSIWFRWEIVCVFFQFTRINRHLNGWWWLLLLLLCSVDCKRHAHRACDCDGIVVKRKRTRKCWIIIITTATTDVAHTSDNCKRIGCVSAGREREREREMRNQSRSNFVEILRNKLSIHAIISTRRLTR